MKKKEQLNYLSQSKCNGKILQVQKWAENSYLNMHALNLETFLDNEDSDDEQRL